MNQTLEPRHYCKVKFENRASTESELKQTAEKFENAILMNLRCQGEINESKKKISDFYQVIDDLNGTIKKNEEKSSNSIIELTRKIITLESYGNVEIELKVKTGWRFLERTL